MSGTIGIIYNYVGIAIFSVEANCLLNIIICFDNYWYNKAWVWTIWPCIASSLANFELYWCLLSKNTEYL